MNQLDIAHADQDQHLNAFVNNLQNTLGNNFNVVIQNGHIVPGDGGFAQMPQIIISHNDHENINASFFVEDDRSLEVLQGINLPQGIIATGNIPQAEMNTVLSAIQNSMLQQINELHIETSQAVLNQINNIFNPHTHAINNHAHANLNQNNANQQLG